MWKWLHRLASGPNFYSLTKRLQPWLGWLTGGFFLLGLFWGLVLAPPDYQQGDSYRIIYIHVPAAWMSLLVYVVMTAAGVVGLVWRIKLAEMLCVHCAPLGASFTFLALASGMLWGKPMWGTYWVWDARLTSELILLFLYLGIIALQTAIEDRRTAARASAVLALVGLVDIPIIHYSVTWWNTLHQGPTVTRFDAPSIDVSMLIPLLIMTVAFMLYFVTVLFLRVQNELITRERDSHWVRELMRSQ